ncbi:hypothetical protein FHS14_002223 [Paenibacillus baekrokdamisoli]|nr:hypothetical protein [Paenibacillus baekrokdamisoli]MBB3069233.1 hypothetical protein [Paenibacillus baekrokdamisoli]
MLRTKVAQPLKTYAVWFWLWRNLSFDEGVGLATVAAVDGPLSLFIQV